MEIPYGAGCEVAVQRKRDAMRRKVIDLAHKEVARAYIDAVIRAVGNRTPAEECVAACEQPNRLHLGSLCVHEGVVKKLQGVQINIPIREDIEVDMMEVIAKRPDGPFNDTAEDAVGRDEAAADRVG